ncbi:MAG: hypothetical protein HPY85_02505 [Anaerolineae bacterium]|nr:hypothetical protein [Anaerolineae bacterium]
MQEITNNVFFETSYPGVTLGAINTPQGLLMIDSPIYAEDARSWRSALMNFSNNGNRLLVALDAHHDRSLGLRNLECRLIGHESLTDAYGSRPVSIKAQVQESGAEWEAYGGLGSIRWLVPEITFSDVMILHWNDMPIRLEYHPGPSTGASWVVIPKCGIAFVGDSVISDQPPFLADANIPIWIQNLKVLLTPAFQNFTLISGRSGLVTTKEVQDQIRFLERVDSSLRKYTRKSLTPAETESLAEKFMTSFTDRTMYFDRLKHGLFAYYERHFPSMHE